MKPGSNTVRILQRGKVLAEQSTAARTVTKAIETWADVRTRQMRDSKQMESGYYDLEIVSMAGMYLDGEIKIA